MNENNNNESNETVENINSDLLNGLKPENEMYYLI